MIEASQRYHLIYASLAFARNVQFLQRLKENFPVEIPFIDEEGLSDDQREALDTYIYISDDGGFDNVFNKMCRKHPQVGFTALGKVSGKEVVRLLEKCQAEVRNSIKLGHYRITTGLYRGLHVEVVGHEGDEALCQYEILKKIKEMRLPIASLEPIEKPLDPWVGFVNFQEQAMSSGNKTAIVVDGNLCLYRNIFGYNNMYTKKNKRFVGGCHGFYFSMLKLKQLHPEAEIHVVFDGFDAEKFANNPEYKAGRPQFSAKIKEAFKDNREWCKQFVASVGFHLYHEADIEGDDLVGSIARRLVDVDGYHYVQIYSQDYDFYSQVDDNVHLLVSKQTFRGHTQPVTPLEARECFGVNENYKINWLRAFTGDSSDNIWTINKFYKETLDRVTRFETRDYLPIINSVDTLDELKHAIVNAINPKTSAPMFPEFIESGQFDKNLNLLTIKNTLLHDLPDLSKYANEFDDQRAQDLLEEVSFYKELEQWSRVGRVFRSIW